MRSRIRNAVATAACAILAMAGRSVAEPLRPETVPASSLWVMHVDMDALRQTGVWKSYYEQAQKQLAFLASVERTQNALGARFPDDLRGLTLAGSDYSGQKCGMTVDASLGRGKVEQYLKKTAGASPEFVGSHALLRWSAGEGGGTQYCSVVDDCRIVVSRDKQWTAQALDVLGKKAEGARADGDLFAGLTIQGQAKDQPPILLYLAADDMARLKGKAQFPLFTQAKSLWCAAVEDHTNLAIKLKVTAETPEAAANMLRAAEGYRAIMLLAASDTTTTQQSTDLRDILKAAAMTTDGATFSLVAAIDPQQWARILAILIPENR